MFLPVTEKTEKCYFINESPENIVKNGDVYDVPWITGVVKNEGLTLIAGSYYYFIVTNYIINYSLFCYSFLFSDFALKKDIMKYVDKNWQSVASDIILNKANFSKPKQAEIATAARKYYFGNKNFSTDPESIRTLAQLFGDVSFVIGHVKAAKLQSEVNECPVRAYYYAFEAATSYIDTITKTNAKLGK